MEWIKKKACVIYGQLSFWTPPHVAQAAWANIIQVQLAWIFVLSQRYSGHFVPSAHLDFFDSFIRLDTVNSFDFLCFIFPTFPISYNLNFVQVKKPNYLLNKQTVQNRKNLQGVSKWIAF